MKKIYFFLVCNFSLVCVVSAQWSPGGSFFRPLPRVKIIDSLFKITKLGLHSDLRFKFAGTDNTFYGTGAGSSAGSGSSYNCGFGYDAMPVVSTGNDNCAFGADALEFNTSGIQNTAIGAVAIYTNTTGSYNSAVGVAALHGNTTGSYNIAIGQNALYSNTSASYNSALGTDALYSDTTGTQNVAVGYGALYANVTASNNSALGYEALNNSTGSDNTGVGSYALQATTSGSYNTGIGDACLDQNTTGSSNTGLGTFALNLTTGSSNTGVGYSALYNNTTGTNNTAVGYNAGPGSTNTGLSNSSAFGNGATNTASNQVVIGNSSVTSIGGYVAWTNFSDGRFKKNIQENVPGLAFIKLLTPITYNLDVASINNNLNAGKSSSNDETGITQKQKIVYTGFVAQDVETAAKKVGYDFSGIAIPQNDKDFYGLRYSDFVPPLVKAEQELSAKNDSLQSVIDSLKSAQTNLQSQVNNIAQQLNSLKTTVLSNAPALKQNDPNPFTSTTIINYNLPGNTVNAQLIITDGQGRVLKDVVLNNSKGPGQAIVNAGELASGIYFYSLVVNGRSVDTKKMILTK